MNDTIDESARSGRLIVWEEAARDGAQAKTLLNATQRVTLARETSAIFGGEGHRHLIFAAGFPSIHRSEFEIIREVAAEVDTCWIASHGRGTREDIALGARAVAGARYGRVTFFVPASEPWARRMLDRALPDVLPHAVGLARHALDLTGGAPVDVALADASRSDAGFLADLTLALAAEGIAVVKLCDSVGCLFPWEIARLFGEVRRRCGDAAVLGAHLHNDAGLALANNLEALRVGVRILASSWLGLGERAGLGRTEELLLASGRTTGVLAMADPLFERPPDLRRVVPIARGLAGWLHMPLRVTDPIVGTGVNSISSGTPFIAPSMFQPYDPEAILGVPPTLQLTHLASGRVIAAIAEELGFVLDERRITEATEWVKSTCYERGAAVIARNELAQFLARGS